MTTSVTSNAKDQNDSPYKIINGVTYPSLFDGLTEEIITPDPPYICLANEIHNKLPLFEVSFQSDLVQEKTHDCRKRIVEIYVESLGRLKQMHHEYSQFMETVIRTNFEFRYQGVPYKGHQKKVTRQKLKELQNKAPIPRLEPDQMLRAENVVQDNSALFYQLQNELRKITKSFCKGIYDSLRKMVDKELVGVVEWSDSQTCAYHFFREQVIQTSNRSKKKRRLKQRGQENGSTRVDTYQVTKTYSGHRIHRQGRFEHHLMDAKTHELQNNPVMIPEPFQQVLVAIPDFLKSRCSVLDGTRIWEQTIEWDYKHEKWTEQKIRDESEIVSLPRRWFELDQFYYDPAILFDDFVLTGWGPDEIQAEENRRSGKRVKKESGQQKVKLHRQVRNWTILQVTMLIIALTLLNRFWPFAALGMAAMLACVPAWSFLSRWANFYGKTPQLHWKLTTNTLLAVGTMMVYQYSWACYHRDGPLFGFSVGLLLAASCFWYFTKQFWNQLPSTKINS